MGSEGHDLYGEHLHFISTTDNHSLLEISSSFEVSSSFVFFEAILEILFFSPNICGISMFRKEITKYENSQLVVEFYMKSHVFFSLTTAMYCS